MAIRISGEPVVEPYNAGTPARPIHQWVVILGGKYLAYCDDEIEANSFCRAFVKIPNLIAEAIHNNTVGGL